MKNRAIRIERFFQRTASLRRLLVLVQTLPVALLLLVVPASADPLDILAGKFAFDWHRDPDRQRCVTVGEKMLAQLKSANYRCDLTPKTNTSAGSTVRMCTRTGGRGRGEYLIFDTLRACEEERKTQASNE